MLVEAFAMPDFTERRYPFIALAKPESLEILHAIGQGCNTRIMLESRFRLSEAVVASRLSDLTFAGLVTAEYDHVGIPRLFVDHEAIANLSAFISALGVKPVR